MNFKKKAIGGCDQEDVLDKFEDVTLLYQKLLKDMDAKLEQANHAAESAAAEAEQARRTAESAVAELAQAKQTAENAMIELAEAKQIAESASMELNALKSSKDQDMKDIEALKNQIHAGSEAEDEFREKSRLLTESMVRQERERAEIISWAEKEAQKIINKAENDAQKMIGKAENDANVLARRKEADFERELSAHQLEIATLKAECDFVRQEKVLERRKIEENLSEVRKDLKVFITDIEQLFEHLQDTIGDEQYALDIRDTSFSSMDAVGT